MTTTGDGDRDTFRYETLNDSGVLATTRDTIIGFVLGQDKIDLKLIDANPGLAGNQAFKVVNTFTSAKGEVRLLRVGADTIVQIDGDVDNAIDMTLRVVNAHLRAGDLIL